MTEVKNVYVCPQCKQEVDELVDANDLGFDRKVCHTCYGDLIDAADYAKWIKKQSYQTKMEHFVRFLMLKENTLYKMIKEFEAKEKENGRS